MGSAPVSEQVEARVERIARLFVERYKWRLLTPAHLAELALEFIGEGDPAQIEDKQILAACRRAASRELYSACERAGLKLATLQEQRRGAQAFADLGLYLASIAAHLGLGNDTEDALQDTLLLISKRYSECNSPDSFLAWVATILRNHGRDILRADKGEQSIEALVAESPAVAPRLTKASDRSVDPVGLDDFLQVLHNCLPDDEQREIALFVFIAGLKRRQFAQLFDKPLWRYDRLVKQVEGVLRDCQELMAQLALGRAQQRQAGD